MGRQYILAAASVAAAFALALPASAADILTQPDQSQLDTFGTATFDSIVPTLGSFSDTFTFTTSKTDNASSQVSTVSLKNGSKNIEFTSISLDGHTYTQTSFFPKTVSWELANTLLANGPHTITVDGKLVTGPSGSYSGTLDIMAVPEPGAWALLLLGLGGVGMMLRANRRSALTLA